MPAGNQGSGAIYPPANDPFVITVGAVDGNGGDAITDDAVASFSAYGTTLDGFAKPDLVAPGKDIGLMADVGTLFSRRLLVMEDLSKVASYPKLRLTEMQDFSRP